MASKHTLPITLSGTGNELSRHDTGSEQTGGPGTLTLKVSGEPARLQYRYQQTNNTIKSGKFDQNNWSLPEEVDGGLFTIRGLAPAAVAGSLYVQVREFAKTWRNWSEIARIKKLDGSQVGASANDADNDEEVQAVSKKRPVVLDDDNDSDDDGDGDDESPAPASASGTALPAPPPPLSTQESVQSSSGQSTGSPAKQGKPGNPRWVRREPGQGTDEPPPQLAQLKPGQWVQLSLTELQQLYDALEAKWSSGQSKEAIKNAPRVKPYEWGGHKISIRKTDPEQADSSKQPAAARRSPPTHPCTPPPTSMPSRPPALRRATAASSPSSLPR